MSKPEALQRSIDLSQLQGPKIRLEYLDGLRGLSAIYVVTYHIYIDISEQLQTIEKPQLLPPIIQALLSHGRISVAAFIVLSGYCLMLPVAKTVDGQIKGGCLSYLKRRGRRILPPYYAALMLSLLLSLVIPAQLIPFMGAHWNHGQPDLDSGTILSHILLIHNFSHNWEYKIDPPMWSVAVEWQIYFLFPLLLLPLWRRFGTVVVSVIACLFPFIAQVFTHGKGFSFLFYITLFTLGMAAATIGFSKQRSLQLYKEKIPWNLLAILFVTIWLALLSSHSVDVNTVDQLFGLAVVCMMIACSSSLIQGKSNFCLRLFESPWAVALGAFSYSLYLTHAMVLALAELCLSRVSMAPLVKLFVLIAIVLPLSVLFAYFFHLMFEKRFMSYPSNRALK
ncbi:MAG: acyltransferase [Kovacikia sp.]